MCAAVKQGAVAFISLVSCESYPPLHSIIANLHIPLIQVDYNCPEIDRTLTSGTAIHYIHRYPPTTPDVEHLVASILQELQWRNIVFISDEFQGELHLKGINPGSVFFHDIWPVFVHR